MVCGVHGLRVPSRGYRPAVATQPESGQQAPPRQQSGTMVRGKVREGTPLDPDQEFDNLTLSQWLTVFSGIAFVAFGIAGLAMTGLEGFTDANSGMTLAGIELNPLHSVVHLALGLPGLVLWRRVRLSIGYGVLLAIAYGSILVYGLRAIDQPWDVLSLNAAGNWLHLTLAGLGVGIALLGVVERRQSLPDDRRGRHEGLRT
jgi:hypothetical protein